MKIKEAIRHFREAKKISQAELGRRIGVSSQFMGRLENREEKLSVEQLQSIAAALEVPVLEILMYDTTEPYPAKLKEELEALKETQRKYEVVEQKWKWSFERILQTKKPELNKPVGFYSDEDRKKFEIKAFRLALRDDWFFAMLSADIIDRKELPQHFQDILNNPSGLKMYPYDGDEPLE